MSRGGTAGGDGLGVFEARLAEMGVEIEKARGDDDTLVIDSLRLLALKPDDRLENAVGDDDLARAFAAGDGVDQPGLLELEPLEHLADAGAGCFRSAGGHRL